MPALISEPCDTTIDTYTVTFAKGVPARGYIIGSTADGARVLARVPRDAAPMLHQLLSADPIGKPVRIEQDGETNIIAAIGGAG